MASRKLIAPWIVLTTCVHLYEAHLDLYMNETETRRLLGIPGELYYVRNGIINEYALTFNLPIKTEVDDIYFTWQNQRKSVTHPMLYNMGITVSNPRAMAPPIANIDKDGVVPEKKKSFSVRLQCTGKMTVEVDIVIQMNISIFSISNLTTLNLRRKKMCLKGDFGDHNHHKIVIPDDNKFKANGNVSYTFPEEMEHEISGIVTTSTSIFYIAVGCACGAIFLIAITVAVCYLKCHTPSHNARKSETSSSQALSHSAHTFLRADTPNNSVTGLPNMRRGFSPLMEIKPTEARAMLGEIHIERNKISLGDVLQEGTFGRIYHGTLIGDDENEIKSRQEVFIKTVTDQARQDQIETIMRECCIMKGFYHQNVNPVIAACMEDDTQPLLIYPYANEGNLKKFLQRCKMSDMPSHCTLSTQQLVYMAICIIRGVQYLHRKRIVHKDLATRNCVVDNQLTVRVTDTALSRDLFPNDYHCLGDNENRPVKWLAIESLLDRKFSPASDVWAFGVTLWELMTMAQQPYGDVDPFEMATYLKEGFRISQPINCPDELFAVMACCWAMADQERPKFSQLLACLQDFYTALGRFI